MADPTLPIPERRVRWTDLLTFAVLGLVAFLPFLGAAPLFDWDEINFAESAREMLVTNDFFQVRVNYEPFWEKPPLFFWLQVLAMKIFGVGDFAARLPNALVGAVTLASLCYYGTRMQGRRYGRLLAGFYFVSILPFLYFKSGIIDPTFNFFIFLSLIQILRYETEFRTRRHPAQIARAPWMAGLWAGLATLTKGPVALIVIFLVYLIFKLIYDRVHIPWKAAGKFLVVYVLVILSWFGSIVLLTDGGLDLVEKFIVYQAELFSQPVAGHEQPFFYHPLVFVIGCFPLSVFAFRAMFHRSDDFEERYLKRFMVVWFWTVMILFTIVRTKIVHYSSLTYFPGAFLAALWFREMVRKRLRLRWDNYVLYGLGIVVFGLLPALLNIGISYLPELAANTDNPFVAANLRAEAGWSGFEWIIGALFTLVLLLGLWLLHREKYRIALFLHIVTTPIYLNAMNLMVVPKVAEYTQMAAQEFFIEVAEEDAYLMVDGYKSYAHYWYGRVKPFPHPEIPVEERGAWMARGPIDKPVYLVTRKDRVSEDFERHWFPDFEKLYEKNGFVFYLREVEPETNASDPS